MAASPIDLSAGLVPKAGSSIDLSAGLVPKVQPDTRSLFQKAKDNFNAATQGAKPGDGAIKGAIEDVGAGGGDIIRALAHPINTINAMTSTPDPDMALAAHIMGDDTAMNKVNATTYPTAARTIGQMGTGAILGEAAGRSIAPVAQAARSTIGRAVLLGKTPEGAYESALKPSTTLSQAERDAAIRTGIDNELPVSKAGVQKLYDLVDDYNQKIAGEINSDPTRPIDPNKVATRADLAKAKFSKQVNAGGDLSAIDASKQQFLQEQGATPATATSPAKPAPPMNAIDAQEMKQGTYQVLKGKFGEQGSASVEAQKSLARGLKEEIANQFPEISNLNASESRLLNLQPILERAVGRVSNHQLIGIGTPVAGAAAKAVTGSGALGVVTGVLKAVLDNPEMKSKLAIAVSKGAKIPIGEAAARVQAYSAALGSTAAGAQGYSSGDNPNSPTTPQ